MPAHKDVSLKFSAMECVLFGNWSIRQVAAQFAVSKSTVHDWVKQYRKSHNLGRRPGSGRRHISTREEDAALVAETERDPFQSSVDLIQAVNFSGCPQTARNRLKEVGIHCHHAAVKEILNVEHRRRCLEFAVKNIIDHDWKKIIFSDEVTFSTANDGPHLVYRRGGHCARSGRVSVHCWGWISIQGAGVLERVEGRLNTTQYTHILENALLLCTREIFPDGDYIFQQDNHPVHTSDRVQRWL